nr:restriction endonuclease subunit S [Mycoplasmopsis agalactiae]
MGNLCSINCGSLDANAMENNGKYDFFTSGIEVYKINNYAFEGPGISIAGNGANMGYLHLTNGKYNAYQRTYILQNIKLNRIFLYSALLNNFLPKCEKLTKFGGIPYLVFEQIYDHVIFKPIDDEQSKISSLFSSLDSLITLHQRKLSSLKNLKNRLLDKMFCDEKSQFPSIRFKEFTNAWEQWKIGDLLTERLEFSKQTIDFPLMAFIANEGITPKGERYDRSSLVKDVENKIYMVTKYGDFIYSSNNLDRGSIGANKYGNACISPVYSVFRPTNLSDSRFIEKVLCRNDLIDKILRYRQGVVYGQLRIHESAFLNINLNSPLLPEQHKIGRLLSNLDSLIALHQRKLSSLKNLKNRLLDKMFCDEKSQFPSIRFKEFTNAWEQEKLGNLVDIYDGIHHTPHYKNKGIMFLSVEDIKTLNSNKFISESEFKTYYKNYPTKNDILMTRIGDIGSTNIVRDNSFKAFYVSLALLKYKKTNPQYLNSTINSRFTQQDIRRLSLTTAIPIKINKNEICKVNVCVTGINEQEKIGSVFSILDSLITLHQRKLSSLKNLKNRLLDKMFCDEKSQFPSIRFKEFTNAWEQEKLGNFGTSTGGSSIENFFNNTGKYKVISIGSFSEDNTYNDQGLRIDYSSFIKDKILKKDNIVMMLNDKSSEAKILGKALLIEKDDEFVYNQRVQKIDINKDRFLSKFIFTLLNSNNREKITLLAQGNTQIYVNWSSISSIEYLIPNLGEQTKISSLFTLLDSLITLHQRG